MSDYTYVPGSGYVENEWLEIERESYADADPGLPSSAFASALEEERYWFTHSRHGLPAAVIEAEWQAYLSEAQAYGVSWACAPDPKLTQPNGGPLTMSQHDQFDEFAPRKAQRKRTKARLAITGPAGSGKSLSALYVARGLVGPTGSIIVIDTERLSIDTYEGEIGEFQVIEFNEPYSPERYKKAITAAVRSGADCIVIDSITHEWTGKGGVLEIKDAMPGNNDMLKWSKVTPMHNEFIDAMLAVPCHLVVTMRSKVEYVEGQKNGRTTFVKAGTGPQQRDGMEYEFTTFLKLTDDHVAMTEKDRTRVFEGRYEKLAIKHGDLLRAFHDSGATFTPLDEEFIIAPAPSPTPAVIDPQAQKEIKCLTQWAVQLGYGTLAAACAELGGDPARLLTNAADRQRLGRILRERVAVAEAAAAAMQQFAVEQETSAVDLDTVNIPDDSEHSAAKTAPLTHTEEHPVSYARPLQPEPTAAQMKADEELRRLREYAAQVGYASLEAAAERMRYKYPRLLTTASYRKTMEHDFRALLQEQGRHAHAVA